MMILRADACLSVISAMVYGYPAVWRRIGRDYFRGAYCESHDREKVMNKKTINRKFDKEGGVVC